MNSKKIIGVYLCITGLFTLSSSLIWGINTLFLLDAGLDIYQVFIVNAIFTGAMALFEIPTGVFADTLGRRKSFIMSTIVLSMGTFAYALVSTWENNYMYFAIVSVVLGLAFTFYTGAVEAWLVDALKVSDSKRTLESVFAKAGIVTNIAMLIGTVSGGLIGTIDLRIPYVIRGIILIIAAILAMFGMKEYGFTPRALTLSSIPKEIKTITSDSFSIGIKHRSVRLHIIITFVFSSFMMWGWYAWQPLFLNLYGDTSAVWLAGIISALISLSSLFANMMMDRIAERFTHRSTLLLWSYLFQSLCIITIGFSKSFALSVSMFLVFAFFMGLNMPIKQAYLHGLIPSDKRATIISLDSLVGSGGSVLGQVGLGYLSKTFSITFAYLVGGVFLLARLPATNQLRKKKDPEDVI